MNKSVKFISAISTKLISAILVMAVSSFALDSLAQTKGHKVTGIVSDNEGKPLAGATVIIKGVNRGAVADSDGRYVLANVSVTDKLVFSFLGMISVEESVGDRKEINVSLEPDAVLEETVVIGYSEVRTKDLTGSVGRADINSMLKTNAGNLAESFAGRVAGVQVYSNEGMPGAEFNIVVRGNNSVTQANSPLYVIDGFPMEDASMNMLEPSDIGSISILKDASATAIYGARAANGVVIITTKLGTPGKTRVSFDATAGFAQVARKISLMDAYDFVSLQKEIMTEDDFNRVYLPEGGSIEDYKNVRSIDYQDVIFRTAPVQKYSLNLSGGNRSTRFSTTFSVYDQDGIIKASNYSRYQGRATLDHRWAEKWHAQVSLNYARTVQKGESPSQTLYSGSANLLPNVWSYRPFASIGDDNLLDEWIDPSINATMDNRVNPMYIVSDEYRKRVNNNVRINAFVEYEVVKGLKIKVMGGFLNDGYKNEMFNGSRSRSGNKFRPDGVNASVQDRSMYQWVNENTINYKTALGKNGRHNLDFLVGQTMQGSRYSNTLMKVTQIPNERLGMSGISEGVPMLSTYDSAEWTLMSFLGRINYNYDSRYYLTASFRADGSSKFSRKNRWGYFPSASAAWAISNEPFLRGNKVVSELKLRASWGMTGNNRISEYAYLPQMQGTESSEYPFDNQNNTGYIHTNMGNRDIKWETTEQFDLGLDFGLLDNRISISADLYYKRTYDLLLMSDIPLSTGFPRTMMNVGSISNKGLEISLQTENIRTKNFRWTTDFNIAFNRNKVLSLYGDQKSIVSIISYSNAYITEVGKPMGMIYGYVYEGTYKYDDFNLVDGKYILKDEIPDNGTGRGATRPGDAKFRDINGDRTVNNEDCTVIGNGHPLHTGGFNNTFEFYGVDLNIFFQWNYGNDILNANRLNFMRGKSELGFNRWKAYSDRWTPENSRSDIPRVGGWGSGQYSSFEVEDGSFLRLKNLSIGYTFPQKWMKKLHIQKLRVYCSFQDLYTFTNYSGYDPEVSTRNTALTPGYDWSAYPRARMYNFGLNVVF